MNLLARELVARERTRVEALLEALTGEIGADVSRQRQQTGEYEDIGSSLDSESVSVALAADLRNKLAAVGRPETRIARGTYGRSVQSGLPIPDERLEVKPLAERTVEEQRLCEAAANAHLVGSWRPFADITWRQTCRTVPPSRSNTTNREAQLSLTRPQLEANPGRIRPCAEGES